MGLVGCVFLVLMTVMTFLLDGNIKVSSLIVTVFAVVLFAMSIALGTNATDQELLAAKVAYTAVLLIFVDSAIASSPRKS